MMADPQPFSKLFRFAISFLLVGHLLAIFLPPLSYQTRGPLGQSPSVATVLAPLEGYSQFLYMDRGYAFFAPDPGPAHLIQAAITERDGRRLELMFPDREQQWPRLLYHRHFMITEFLDQIYQAPGPPPELVELDREEAELWVRSRARYEHVRQSVVEHLQHEYPGREVVIRRIEHLIPNLLDFQREPIALNDQRLYRVILDQPIDFGPSGDLVSPIGPPETIPPPEGGAVEPDAEAAGAETGQSSKSADPADMTDSLSPDVSKIGDPTGGDSL